MTAAQIAQLAIILAPIAEKIIHNGTELVVQYKKDLTQADIESSLELSKSANWPKLDFRAEGDPEETQP